MGLKGLRKTRGAVSATPVESPTVGDMPTAARARSAVLPSLRASAAEPSSRLPTCRVVDAACVRIRPQTDASLHVRTMVLSRVVRLNGPRQELKYLHCRRIWGNPAGIPLRDVEGLGFFFWLVGF